MDLVNRAIYYAALLLTAASLAVIIDREFRRPR